MKGRASGPHHRRWSRHRQQRSRHPIFGQNVWLVGRRQPLALMVIASAVSHGSLQGIDGIAHGIGIGGQAGEGPVSLRTLATFADSPAGRSA